jgi:hypothetical protein
MGTIFKIHQIFGEMILPLLTVIAAIVLTVQWKPDAPRSPITRFFPMLVDIQATLGILYFIYMLMIGGGAKLFSFPFILHPILGLVAAGIGHMAVGKGPFTRLGRWAPLAGLAVLLVLVLINVMVAIATRTPVAA